MEEMNAGRPNSMYVLRPLSVLLLVVWVLVSGGCSERRSQETQAGPNSPEEAYRQFMLAELTGDETEIRKLIVANDDAAILWKGGSYPTDVAALLAEQYRTMEISRAEAEGDGDSKRVRLNSSAFPLPLTVEYMAGSWKVDTAPIIEGRKASSGNQKPQ